ncbi:CRISPR-associated helicase Cas3' [Chloroflexia bacterium SDU3-3]|nr:CRISPR-associated helicase Cas3' [Chloroflexia bacterium SDU3-3]
MNVGNGLALRPFQQRVFEAVWRGERVILQAPTGAGKTRAALNPFVQHLAEHVGGGPETPLRMPLTCRYAVPLRVLASQFFGEFGSLGDAIDRHWSTRTKDIYQTFGQQLVQVQTGEQPMDSQLESALTFCTIDQLLASFLGIPYGIGGRRANLNVGAVIGSYLVLDEFHLYPLARDGKGAWGARTTALQMLQMLNGQGKKLTPFVLMTATFSSQLIGQLAQLLDATVISVDSAPSPDGGPSELDALNAGRTRHVTVHDSPMDVRSILDTHQGCSLVVCNTVLRAQQVFVALREALEGSPTRVLLLHSRFTDDDRQRKQAELEQRLGKQAWDGDIYLGEDVIVVGTQVVEVGLDISVRTLHSEAAPANSIIQRAGRCARFAQQRGQVHIYPVPPNDDGKTSYRPYDEAKTLATSVAFDRLRGQHVGFAQEQEVIDAVHSEEDAALLDTFRRQQPLIREKMYRGWAFAERAIATTLIRDVQQVSLLIHPDPNAAITERPWDWQSFSLAPGQLIGRWDRLHEAASQRRGFGDDGPIMWAAQIEEPPTDAGERVPPRYRWEPVATREGIASALMLTLSPDIASYSSDIGLVLRDGALDTHWPTQPFASSKVQGQATRQIYGGYDQESYAEHIGGLLRAYRESRLADDARYIARRLEQAAGLADGAVDWAIRLAIACHDIGKLGQGWQGWAQGWQATLVSTFPAKAEAYQPRKAPFAHTDSEPHHRDLERAFTRKTPRPHHACESAALAANLIFESLGNDSLARATVAAIARHHSAASQRYEPIQLIPDARRYVAEMLDVARQGTAWPYDIQELDLAIDHGTDLDAESMTLPRDQPGLELEMWLYYVIVRALRLADGRSFAFQ